METDNNKDSYPNTPEEIKKALMVQNYILRYKADKFNEKNWIFSDELKIALDSFEKKNEIIFKETKKSLKNYFIAKNLILPINWKEVFLDWFLNKYADDRYFLKDGTGHITKHLLDVIANREFYIEWAKQETDKLLENLPSQEPEKVEIYNNLPHALCILDDLGILDLIEEKFKYKNYSGKAPITNKAKLIATILKIDNGEKVRHALKNKEYLSETAKKSAKKTLNDLGLPSSFNDD